MDENRKNNNPSNLVPLCPTHHQYIHSRYRDEVLPIVEEYMKNFKEKK
jgi:predicted HNH restriction endonuclease